MNPFLVLYINGRALLIRPRYDNQAESIVEAWENRKSSKDSFISIEHGKGTLHVDLNSVDAINLRYS